MTPIATQMPVPISLRLVPPPSQRPDPSPVGGTEALLVVLGLLLCFGGAQLPKLARSLTRRRVESSSD